MVITFLLLVLQLLRKVGRIPGSPAFTTIYGLNEMDMLRYAEMPSDHNGPHIYSHSLRVPRYSAPGNQHLHSYSETNTRFLQV